MTSRIFTASLALVAALSFAGAALAANGETPLGQCYNRVIAICNTTAHPVSCSEAAMDDCDEEYGNQVGGLPLNLTTPKPRPKIGLLLPAVQK